MAKKMALSILLCLQTMYKQTNTWDDPCRSSVTSVWAWLWSNEYVNHMIRPMHRRCQKRVRCEYGYDRYDLHKESDVTYGMRERSLHHYFTQMYNVNMISRYRRWYCAFLHNSLSVYGGRGGGCLLTFWGMSDPRGIWQQHIFQVGQHSCFFHAKIISAEKVSNNHTFPRGFCGGLAPFQWGLAVSWLFDADPASKDFPHCKFQICSKVHCVLSIRIIHSNEWVAKWNLFLTCNSRVNHTLWISN